MKYSIIIIVVFLTSIIQIYATTPLIGSVENINLEKTSSLYNKDTNGFDWIILNSRMHGTYKVYDSKYNIYQEFKPPQDITLSKENNFSSHHFDQTNSNVLSYVETLSDSGQSNSITSIGYIKTINAKNNNEIEIILNGDRDHYFGFNTSSFILTDKNRVSLMYLALANDWKVKISGIEYNNERYIKLEQDNIDVLKMINGQELAPLYVSFVERTHVTFAKMIIKYFDHQRYYFTEMNLRHIDMNNSSYNSPQTLIKNYPQNFNVLNYRLVWKYNSVNDGFKVNSVEAPYTE